MNTAQVHTFPLIKLAKKLKGSVVEDIEKSGEKGFPLIKLAKKLKGSSLLNIRRQ